MKQNPKISGFKTPDSYFENFEAGLFAQLNSEKFPKSNGFKVPEGYFETLENTIITKVSTTKKSSKVISIFSKKYVGYAAAIAAILIVGIMLLNFNRGQSNLDTIQIGLIDKYIEEGNLNMDLYDITTYFETNEIPLEDFETHHLSQASLKSYLLENIGDDWLFED